MIVRLLLLAVCFLFFNDTATTEIYTLSLHDALPIWRLCHTVVVVRGRLCHTVVLVVEDRKSTRLNSSHGYISYAVFCLKKKNLCSENKLQQNRKYPTVRISAMN